MFDATIILLSKTGWHSTSKEYQPSSSKSAYENMLDDLHDIYQDPQSKAMKGPFCALLYYRHDGTGHCVVASLTAGGMDNDDDDIDDFSVASFTCYQTATYGVDLSHEVRASKNMILFAVQCPPHTQVWHDFVQRRDQRTKELTGSKPEVESTRTNRQPSSRKWKRSHLHYVVSRWNRARSPFRLERGGRKIGR